MASTPPRDGSAAASLLQVEGVDVVYAARGRLAPFRALRGIDVVVRGGHTVGIVGESGSGKSTLGKAILGLQPVAAGTIRFAGADITHADRPTRQRLSQYIQVVFQDPYSSFNPSRTIGQSVAETLTRGPALDKAEVRRRVGDMLERVGMDRGAMSRYPSSFSGGQRQRLAIARALLPRPQLVICDEAVSALDLSVQAQVLNLLADLRADMGVSYLFISHDIVVVRYLCDEIVVLRRGQVVEAGTSAEICNNPRERYTQALLAAAPVADADRQAERRRQRQLLQAG